MNKEFINLYEELSALYESKQDELNFKNWLNNDDYANLFIKLRQSFKQPENDYYYWIKKKQPKELISFIDNYQNQKFYKEKKHQEIMEGAEFIGEDKGYKVYHITTWEASKTLGQGAKWCISMKNDSRYWNDYTSKGIKFYFFISSNTKYALALYPEVLNVNKFVDENTYLEIANFEIYNAEDKLDYSIINNLPLNLIPENTNIKKQNVNNGLFIENNKLISVFKGLKTCKIPNNITSIGEDAFMDCTYLTSISIPNSVTSIDSGAFSYCESLTTITIPSSITSIGQFTFKHCKSLTSIIIPNSVTSIGNYAFWNCISLTNITIPNSVTSIGDSAFRGCTSLTSIKIPDSVTSISESAFSRCKSLKSIIIPNSVTRIGKCSFEDCFSLTSATIPGSVISISEGAFNGCASLTSISIPNSVTSIGNYAFWNCTSLTSITIPDSVTSIGYEAFYNCKSLQSITIPNSVISIGNNAFRHCSSLTSITIPNSVTSIGEYAFEGCTSLTSITIPNSIKSIGYHAFQKSNKLANIYYDGTEEQWNTISNSNVAWAGLNTNSVNIHFKN